MSDDSDGSTEDINIDGTATSDKLKIPEISVTFPMANSQQRAPQPQDLLHPNRPSTRVKVELQPGHSPLDWAIKHNGMAN